MTNVHKYFRKNTFQKYFPRGNQSNDKSRNVSQRKLRLIKTNCTFNFQELLSHLYTYHAGIFDKSSSNTRYLEARAHGRYDVVSDAQGQKIASTVAQYTEYFIIESRFSLPRKRSSSFQQRRQRQPDFIVSTTSGEAREPDTESFPLFAEKFSEREYLFLRLTTFNLKSKVCFERVPLTTIQQQN